MVARRFTDEQEQKIAQQYTDDKLSLHKLADLYDSTPQSIQVILKRRGVKRRPTTRYDHTISPRFNKTRNVSVTITQTDKDMLVWLSETMGTSKSEAIRTCLRAYVGWMQAWDSKR